MNVTQHGYADDQKNIIARLNRIEGQVRGIKQMTEDGEYCIDILTQISAANSALKSVALLLLDDHLNHCVEQATAGRRRRFRRKAHRSQRGHHQIGQIVILHVLLNPPTLRARHRR